MEKKQLTYRELKKLFIDFLKKENAHERYLHNIRIQRNYEFKTLQNYIDPLTIDTIRKTIQLGYTSGLVDRGFCWADTPQGHDYWEKLNSKWSDVARKYSNKLIAEKI